MSLITRCPACGTMFKVVADQLKISQGWVRCGQCSEVFDAAAHLQPRATPSPPLSPASASSTGDTGSSSAADPTDSGPVAPLATLLLAPEAADSSAAFAQAEPPVAPLSLPEVQVSMPPDLAAEVFTSSVSPDGYALPDAPGREAQQDSSFDEFGAPHEPQQDVSFVRDARRQAFWRQPAMRWTLGAAALVLLTGLLLQVALFQRSALAARQPGLNASFQTLCVYLQCEIQPLRQIESIVIDSSSFNKIGPDAYRLKVVIKNTGSVPLAIPSLELTLTDSQDQALLRRVLTPGELGASADAAPLAAGAEFSGLLAIGVSNPAPAPIAGASTSAAPRPSAPLRIAGYRVLAFYP
ncbi:MAG: DUF3426 domain-containing protein [Polaromonas sp.]|uniref:DUF3426 domain-containing protein n=1 Tax=Polaromonas sp. TaxID=1869339 RepID=UPI0027340187|nr:DUF3426 domain-containing protein [Polaromonas sp.]MDP2817936.1 DUF3426 domain-containing protein [Polaromonas sp.]